MHAFLFLYATEMGFGFYGVLQISAKPTYNTLTGLGILEWVGLCSSGRMALDQVYSHTVILNFSAAG